MNKSDELEQLASYEDNDLKALSLVTKAIREKRDERFGQYYNKLISLGYNIEYSEPSNRYTIKTSKYGIIDYYPKANKILIRSINKWHTAGLRWIIKNLI